MSVTICDSRGGGRSNLCGMVCNRTLPRCLSQSAILVNIDALMLNRHHHTHSNTPSFIRPPIDRGAAFLIKQLKKQSLSLAKIRYIHIVFSTNNKSYNTTKFTFHTLNRTSKWRVSSLCSS
jgi:hypothetical protein